MYTFLTLEEVHESASMYPVLTRTLPVQTRTAAEEGGNCGGEERKNRIKKKKDKRARELEIKNENNRRIKEIVKRGERKWKK